MTSDSPFSPRPPRGSTPNSPGAPADSYRGLPDSRPADSRRGLTDSPHEPADSRGGPADSPAEHEVSGGGAATAVLTRPTAAVARDPRAWLSVATAIFAIAWGGNEFTPLLVMYKRDGLPVTTVDLLLFEYVLGIVPALLIGGPLSDRYGRRPLMLPAPVIAASGSLLLAFGSSSVPMLSAGRVLCGAALGLAMAVGSSWLKELSQPPFAAETASGTGARRSAMSLTGGFGVGAGVAGVLAQWGPLPDSLPYLINVGLCLVAAAWILRAPETLVPEPTTRRLTEDLKIPAVAHRRFRLVVLPVALWLFACSATAYAIMPTLMMPKVHGAPIAFSALITVTTLGCGFAIQSVARRLDRPGTIRLPALALTLVATGMGLAAAASAHSRSGSPSPPPSCSASVSASGWSPDFWRSNAWPAPMISRA